MLNEFQQKEVDQLMPDGIIELLKKQFILLNEEKEFVMQKMAALDESLKKLERPSKDNI